MPDQFTFMARLDYLIARLRIMQLDIVEEHYIQSAMIIR